MCAGGGLAAPASSRPRAQGRAESRREERGGGQPPAPLPEGQGRARHGQMLPGVERTAKGALPRALARSWGHGPVSQLATEAAPAEPRLPRNRASRDTAPRGQPRFRSPGVGAAAPQVWAGVLGGVWGWGDTGRGPGMEPFLPTPPPRRPPGGAPHRVGWGLLPTAGGCYVMAVPPPAEPPGCPGSSQGRDPGKRAGDAWPPRRTSCPRRALGRRARGQQ